MLDRIVGQVGVRFHRHLLENPRPIGAYGLYAQEQLVCDLGDGLAGSELAEYLELAFR